jgi:hypothetical protein
MPNDKSYLTKDMAGKFSFPDKMKPVFERDPSYSNGVNETIALNLFCRGGPSAEAGIELLNLLFEHSFATRDQLERLLTIKGLSCPGGLDHLLDNYAHYGNRFICRFMLSADWAEEKMEKKPLPNDALLIYAMDYNGKYVVQHYGGVAEDDFSKWRSVDQKQESLLVSKRLATLELYLTMLAGKPKSLRMFRSAPKFSLKSYKRDITMSAWFRVMNGYSPVDFLVETIRAEDMGRNWNKKLYDQLEPFFRDESWTKYFNTIPTLILLAENREVAQEVASDCHRALSDSGVQVRVILDEDVSRGLTAMRPYKFDPNAENEGERLKPMQSRILVPDPV